MQVLSVNIGTLQLLPETKSKTKTGIFKYPVAGPVAVEALGLAGDKIGNKKHHGGPDQAVYLFAADDYAWWEKELGRELPFGIFGENVTLSTFGPDHPRIGDIWRLGEVVLQLTAPRIPCSKLAARMEDPTFLKRFVKANRAGAYARVLRPGNLAAGTTAALEPAPAGAPTVPDLFALWHARHKSLDLIERALASPVAERARAALQVWQEASRS